MAEAINRKDFRRVRKERNTEEERAKFNANDIHVTAARSQRVYISYAIGALTGKGEGDEKREQFDSVNIRGMGTAVYNAVNIAEIVKHRVKGLHQITTIGSQVMVDEYEHKDDKHTASRERKVSTITITLSLKPLDKSNPGYQEPIPEDQVTEQEERPRRPRREPGERGARGGRGGRGRGSRDDREDRGPRGGRGGRGRRDDRDDRDDRGPRGGRGGRGGRGRRDDRDDREDRGPRGGRGGRGRRDDRDDRDDRRGGRDDRAPRGGRGGPRDDRAPRGGRGGRDDRAPRGGRGGPRDDRAPRGGRGGYRN